MGTVDGLRPAPALLLDPRIGYRDYLKAQFVAAVQQKGYDTSTALMVEDALRRRFHPIFSGSEDTPGQPEDQAGSLPLRPLPLQGQTL